MKQTPEKTVGIYERPQKKASGLTIAVVIVVILAGVVAAMLLMH